MNLFTIISRFIPECTFFARLIPPPLRDQGVLCVNNIQTNSGAINAAVKQTKHFVHLIAAVMLVTFVGTTSLSAAANSCPGDVINGSVSGTLYDGWWWDNLDDYYQYSPGKGTVTISYSSDERINFEVGSTCDGNNYLSTSNATSGTTGSITISDTDVIYIHAERKNNNTNYAITVTYFPFATAVDDSFSTQIDTTLSGNVLANDAGSGITITATDISGLSGTMNSFNLATGDFSYTPASGYEGTESFSYTITDTLGNSDTATVTIIVSLSPTYYSDGRDFSLRNPEDTRNIVGDVAAIGNSVQCLTAFQNSFGTPFVCNDSANISDVSNDYYTKYVDIDGDASTFNSSSAILDIPAGSTVVWAGLYWQGFLHSCDSGDSNVCRFHGDTSISSDSVDVSTGAANAHQVKFKQPAATEYTVVTAQTVDYIYYSSAKGTVYSGFANVTGLITASGANGTYTVADLQSMEGKWGYGNYGGWSLFVIYEDPNGTLHNNSVFDGLKRVQMDPVTIPITGFYTPAFGPVSSRLLTFAGEGEYAYTPDYITVGGATNYVSNGNNAANNVFNSTMSGFTAIPTLPNNNGIDIDTFDTSAFMTNAQTDTTLVIDSNYDAFYPSVVGFSTQLYQPAICYFEEVYDMNGNALSDGAEVSYGDQVNVKVYLKNEDNETAEQVKIFRTFTDQFTYKQASTYEDNDFNTVYRSVTDRAGDDIFTFTEAARTTEQLTGEFEINLGTGATATTGGDFDPNRESQFTYNAFITTDQNYSIDYNIAYLNPTTGDLYEGKLTNKCVDFNNSFWGRKTVVITQSNVDVMDTYSGSGAGYESAITTKVSGKTDTINAVYLGIDPLNPQPQAYHAPDGTADGKAAPLYVFLKLVDMSNGGTCETLPSVKLNTTVGGSVQAVVQIDPGSVTGTSTPFTMAYANTGSTTKLAKRDVRFQYKAFDYNALITNSGINCVNHSTTGGGIEGLPQCMTSNTEVSQAAENYKAVFGPIAFDRCWSANGQPCLSSHGGVGTAPYDSEFGCLECSLDGFASTCSQDNFAIRPEKFTIDSTDASYPDLLRAGKSYGLSINGVDYDGVTNSMDYNRTYADLNTTNLIKYDINGTVDSSMQGEATWGSIFNILNGQTYVDGVLDTAKYIYDEVGKITIHIEDQTFAAVDVLDTPQTCDPDGSYVCGDRNATYIPDHFDVSAALVNSAGGNNFTYLSAESDQSKMSARYNVTITAEGFTNKTTTNFEDNSYENDVVVNITVPAVSGVGSATVHDIVSTDLLEFGNGEGTVLWNDSNTSLQLSFQYPRTTNVAVNPFIIDGNKTTVNVSSTYTGTAPEGTATIIGIDNTADANVTFLYGRVHAPRYRAMCQAGSCAANVTYFYEFYADKDANATLINALLGTGKQRSVDSVNWYRNSLHNTATDGNVTASTTNIPLSSSPGYTPNGATTRTTYTYNGDKGYPYKGSTIVSSAAGGGTQSWLIYDQYSADGTTQKKVEVEYYGPGKWTTTGDLETHSEGDTTKSKKTNRRIRW